MNMSRNTNGVQTRVHQLPDDIFKHQTLVFLSSQFVLHANILCQAHFHGNQSIFRYPTNDLKLRVQMMMNTVENLYISFFILQKTTRIVNINIYYKNNLKNFYIT